MSESKGHDTSYEWKATLILSLAFGLVGLDRFILPSLFGPMSAELGLNEAHLGQLVGALAVAWGVSAVLFGGLSDRLGRRNVLVPASFALTNTQSANVSVTVGSLTLPWSSQGLPVTLSAQVSGNAGTVSGGTVQFRVSGTVVATVAVSSGRASVSHTIPSTVVPGAVPVEARFSGWNSYPAATGTGSVTIVRRNPVITWAAPAGISQGTPLGSAQLNARAAIAGTFAYSPAAGTILAGGTHTLNVTFTPSDKIRYNSAKSSTNITVTAASSTKPPAVTPVSAVAVREAGTRIVVTTVTFRNSGGLSQSIPITVAALGGNRAIALPVIAPIGENQTGTVTLKFPASVPSGQSTLLLFTTMQGGALSVAVP